MDFAGMETAKTCASVFGRTLLFWVTKDTRALQLRHLFCAELQTEQREPAAWDLGAVTHQALSLLYAVICLTLSIILHSYHRMHDMVA
jgi:hypothetical protein